MTDATSCEFPFAVHTAEFGYAWSNVPPGMTREELDAHYRRAVALRPEFMRVGDVVLGVTAHGGSAVAFSIQVAGGWDANGRDAEYGAFAFVPYADAAKVDFAALLAMDEFHIPSRTPPDVIRYAGPASATLDAEGANAAVSALRRHEPLETVDFSRVGMTLGVYGRTCDAWLFVSVRTGEDERALSTTATPALRSPSVTRDAGARPTAPVAPAVAQDAGMDWFGALLWLAAAVMVAVALFAALRG